MESENTKNDGNATNIVKLKVGRRAYRRLEEYRQRCRIPFRVLFRKIVRDFRVRYEANIEDVVKEMFDSQIETLGGSDSDFEFRSFAVYADDYQYIFNLAKKHFATLARFFPLLVERWLSDFGADLKTDKDEYETLV